MRARGGLVIVTGLIGLVAACTFHHPGAADDGAGPDAPPAVDAPPAADADPNLDSDGDTIFDPADNCIAIPNPAQHDHDLDGRGDECDPCPHLASPTALDADGDQIGDECDPRPALADIRIGFFGFYDPAEVIGWGPGADWQVVGGALVRTVGAARSSFGPPDVLHNPYVASAATVTELAPATGRSVGVSVAVGATQYYSCYRHQGTDAGSNTFYVDAYYGTWDGTTDSQTAAAAGLAAGTAVTFTDYIDPTGTHCVAGSTSLGGTTFGGRDGTVVAWADDLTAAYDFMFIVSVGD